MASSSQEGFRFRNDDGNEAAATWRQDQDVNDTIDRQRNFRLRFIVDASGDLLSQQFTVQYKKVGDSDWTDIPVE